jgi:hypothetical protein
VHVSVSMQGLARAASFPRSTSQATTFWPCCHPTFTSQGKFRKPHKQHADAVRNASSAPPTLAFAS